MNQQVVSLFDQIQQCGVRLLLDREGKLVARGGDFPIELRQRASEHKSDLAKLAAMHQSSREAELLEAESAWKAFATRERGFFIDVLHNAVTTRLRSRYEGVREDYLSGLVTLRDVYDAFNRFAKSTRRRYLVRQLTGSIFEPRGLGERSTAPQDVIHTLFKKYGESEDDPRLSKSIRSCVTPQIVPQEDQLERMSRYFRLDSEQYLERLLTMDANSNER